MRKLELSTKIRDLDLPGHVKYPLARGEMGWSRPERKWIRCWEGPSPTLGDLLSLTSSQIRQIDNIGKTRMLAIEEFLRENDLELADD